METVLIGNVLPPSADRRDGAKRRQIMDGARTVFLGQGFDAASMGEIARAAGVSKGTLYVYFDSKEQLFVHFVREQCGSQAEQVFSLDSDDHDVEAVLTNLGRSFIRFMSQRGTSALRTVISIAERMPEIGKEFYETGPAIGMDRGIRAQVVEKLEGSPLLPLQKGVAPELSGIYALYFKGKLVYIGKASKGTTKSKRTLRDRLNEHVGKIGAAHNIALADVKCRYLTFSSEWWVFAAAGLLSLLIALLTVSYQSIKAGLANPVKSLRTE